jgi:hypothetical protein
MTQPSRTNWHEWVRSNQGVGVVLLSILALLTAYLVSSNWVYLRVRDGFYLGFFPLSAVAIMAATAVGMALDRNRRKTTQTMRSSDWRTWTVPWILTVALLGYFWLMTEVGFVISTPVVLAPTIYFLGARPARSAVVASLLITVCVYVAFRVIGTNIPQGPLPI